MGASGFMSEIFRQAAEATTGVSDPVQALMWDLGWHRFEAGFRRCGRSRRSSSQRYCVHEFGVISLGEKRSTVGYSTQQVVEPGLFGLGKVGQDIGRDLVLVTGVADAEADADIGIADMSMQRTAGHSYRRARHPV